MFLGISLPAKDTVILAFNLVFAAILLLTFIVGFFRGARKSFFYTLFFTIGALGLWFGIFPLAQTIYTMDASFIGAFDGSIQNYIFELVNKELDYGINQGTFSYDAINGIAICVIQIVLFIVAIVFWLIIYRLIIWLIWGIFGRPFLKIKKVKKPSKENVALAKTINDKAKKKELLKPKVIRKKKHRLLGGVVGLVNGFAMCIVLCVPLGGVFSIITSANESAQAIEGETIPSDVKEYLGYADVYDQTWIAKILDNFGEEGLDNEMFDKIFNIEINKDHSVKLRRELHTLADFAVEASRSGVLDIDTNNISLESLKEIDDEQIAKSFEELKELVLLDVVMNIGVDFLEYSDFINNSDNFKNLVIDYEDLRSIKLSEDVANLGKLVGTAIDILQEQEDLSNIDYYNLNTTKLNKFVEELFDIKLVNAGINTGLSYVLELDEVVDFVGDHEVGYENIDWEGDFKKVIEIYQEFVEIGIRFDSEEKISVQLLSNNSQHIQNILDKLYDLTVFNEVKEIAVDFALTELEKNEDIVKYIPEEVLTELKTNGSETLFTELSTVINLFEDLGEKTTLLTSLDNYLASTEEDKKFQLELEPELVYILSDYIEQSSIATPIVLNFAQISNDSIQEQMGFDLYDALVNVEDLSYELDVFGHILEGVEEEGGNLGEILNKLTSEELTTIDLALINGIINEEKAAYVDDDGNTIYYIDESQLLKKIVGPILDDAMADLLNNEKIFSNDDFEWSSEIKALSELADVIAETSGTPGELDIEALQTSFETKIHIDVLETLKNNASSSQLISKVFDIALVEIVGQETLDKVTDLDSELDAFYQVANTLTDEDGYIVIADLQNLHEIKIATLEVASTVVDGSEIIQYFFTEPLTNMGVNVEEITNWNEELAGLVSIANEIAVENAAGERVLDIEGIETQLQDEIPVDVVKAARDIFDNASEDKSTVIIRTLFKDALVETIGDDTFFDGWTNNTWYEELNALYNIANTISNDEGNLVMDELSNMNKLKINTITVASENIDQSSIIKHFFKAPLEDLGVNTDEINDWNEELAGLASIADTIAVVDENNERVLDIEGLETQLSEEIPMATLTVAQGIYEEKTSTVIITSVLETALVDVVEDETFFDTWDNAKWAEELNALNTVAVTLAEGKAGEEKLIIANLSNMETIKVATIEEASTVANDSSLIQHLFKDPLAQLNVEANEINDWNEELVGLASIADTIANDERELEINNLQTQLSEEIPMATLTVAQGIYEEKTSTVIITSVLETALVDVVEDETFFDTWDNAKWAEELNALNTVAGTLAEGEVGEEKLIIANLSNMETIKVATIEEASTVANDSSLIQHLFKDPLTDMGVNVAEIGEDDWNEELAGLATIANSEGLAVNGELEINSLSTQLQEEIPTSVLVNATSVFEEADENTSTVILRTVLKDSLSSTITEEGFFDNWNNAKWAVELNALTSVANTMAENNKLVVAKLSNMDIIYINTLAAMETNIDSSDILKYMAKDSFTSLIGEEKVALIGTPENPTWGEEVHAIKEIAAIEGNTYENNKGEYIRLKNGNNIDTNVFEISIDSKLSNGDRVKWDVVDKSKDVIGRSIVLQTLLEEPFATILEEDNLNWDSERWTLEVTAVAAVTEDLQDNNGYISTSLDTERIPASVLEKTNNHTKSLTIRKMMSDTMTPIYAEEDIAQAPSESWDDNRWQLEINALSSILSTLQDDDGYINISTSFLHRDVKLGMFDEMSGRIQYSTVLQSKIAKEVYTEGGVRLDGTPEVRFDSLEWHNEMMAIDAILHTIPAVGEDTRDASVSYDSLDFENIKFRSLLQTQEHIHESIYIQHKMYISLKGMQEVVFEQYEYDKKAHWYNEVGSIINIAVAYDGKYPTLGAAVTADATIDLNTIDFSGSIKMSVLKVIEENANHSTFIQNKLAGSLYQGYTHKPEVHYKYENNIWNTELEGIYSVATTWFGEDGEIRLSTLGDTITSTSFPVEVLYELSNVISNSLYFQNILQPELVGMVRNNSYYSNADIAIAVPAVNDNWKNDIYALYKAMDPIAVDGKVTLDLTLTESIDYALLTALVDDSDPVIQKSKLLQALLKDTMDSLMTLDTTRTDVAASEFNNFEMSLGYDGTAGEQWLSELGALVVIARDQVDEETNKINLTNVSASGFDMDFLKQVITILDEGYQTTYGMPKIIRSLLIPVLEDASRVGITFETEFNWASHDDMTSDLQYLYNLFTDEEMGLGIETIDDFNLSNPNINVVKLQNIYDTYNGKSVLIQAMAYKLIFG